MRANALFSLRRALLPQSLPGIVLIFLIGAWGIWWIRLAFNPHDQNHLLIINRSGHELVTGGVAEFEGEVDWQVLVPYIRRGDQVQTAVTIVNIERAWLSGTFRIKDGVGQVVAEREITPPGRYCGALVIMLDSDGKSQVAFNEIPESH